MTATRGRTRGVVPKSRPTTRIKATFTVELPPCHHKQHANPSEETGCDMGRRQLAIDAIGAGVQANMVGINQRLMALGASDVLEWEVE